MPENNSLLPTPGAERDPGKKRDPGREVEKHVKKKHRLYYRVEQVVDYSEFLVSRRLLASVRCQ